MEYCVVLETVDNIWLLFVVELDDFPHKILKSVVIHWETARTKKLQKLGKSKGISNTDLIQRTHYFLPLILYAQCKNSCYDQKDLVHKVLTRMVT